MRRTGRQPTPILAMARRRVISARSVSTALTFCLAIGAAQVWAGDDDGPELSPPIDAPVSANLPRIVKPTRAPIVSTPSTSPASTRSPTAVLALPGLLGSNGPPRLPLLPMPEGSVVSGLEKGGNDSGSSSELTLDGPVEMANRSILDRVHPTGEPDGSLGSELVPIQDPILSDRIDAPLPNPTPRRSTTSSSAPGRIKPVLPPPRRARFFGIFPGPVIVPPTALNSRPSSTASSASGSGRDARLVPEDLKAEAAAQVALKRRIEKQARDSVGDRVRSIEVHVDQRTATVQVRGVKFYQKRTVRKVLESLPALTGLRSTIEVLD